VYAAKQGHFRIVQYLLENKCPLIDQVWYTAACNNHLEILKYLDENERSSDEWKSYPSVHHHLEISKYIHDNGWQCTFKICEYCGKE